MVVHRIPLNVFLRPSNLHRHFIHKCFERLTAALTAKTGVDCRIFGKGTILSVFQYTPPAVLCKKETALHHWKAILYIGSHQLRGG